MATIVYTGLKKRKANEFYVKASTQGYYMVIDGYDQSMVSLESNKEAADSIASTLNDARNKKIIF